MLFKCKTTQEYILKKCTQSECAWYIHCGKFCNCSVVASHFGPFSIADIGAMLHVTGERIRQIECNALLKLKEKHTNGEIEPIEFNDPPSLFEESLEYF